MNGKEKIILLKLIKEANAEQIMDLFRAKKINNTHLKFIQENLNKSDLEIDKMIVSVEQKLAIEKHPNEEATKTDVKKQEQLKNSAHDYNMKQTIDKSKKNSLKSNNETKYTQKSNNKKKDTPKINNKKKDTQKTNNKKKQQNKSRGYHGNNFDPNYKENKRKYGDKYDPRIHANNKNEQANDYFVRKYSKKTRKQNRKNRNMQKQYHYEQNQNSYKSRKKRKKANKLFAAFKTSISIFTLLYVIALINNPSMVNNLLNNEKLDSAKSTANAINAVSSTIDSQEVSTDTLDEIEATAKSESSEEQNSTSTTVDVNSLLNNPLVTRDACSTNGSREANVKADIGYADREYYAYTNEYSQLVYVTADKLVQQYKSEEGSNNRYCNAQADVNDIQSGYNRGHVIGDQLGGVSNAYNIFPQLINTNSGKYNNDEIALQNTLSNGGTVTNFEAILTYPNSNSNIPSEYTVTYEVNGITETHTYAN